MVKITTRRDIFTRLFYISHIIFFFFWLRDSPSSAISELCLHIHSLKSFISPPEKKAARQSSECVVSQSHKIYGFLEILWLPSYVTNTDLARVHKAAVQLSLRGDSTGPQKWAWSRQFQLRLFFFVLFFQVIIQYLSLNSFLTHFTLIFLLFESFLSYFRVFAFFSPFHFISLFFLNFFCSSWLLIVVVVFIFRRSLSSFEVSFTHAVKMSVYSKNSHTEENLKKSIYVTSLRVSQYTQMIMVMMMSMRIQLARAALCEEGKKSSASAMPILCVYCAGRE